MLRTGRQKASALREAFIRSDPRLTGQVAPFLVLDIIRSMQIEVHPESVGRYMQHGRFHWMAFCEALEREFYGFVKATEGTLTPGIGSPRRPMTARRPMPALLRSLEQEPAFKSGRFPAPRPTTATLRTTMGSTMSPRAPEMRDVRSRAIRSLNQDIDNVLRESSKISSVVETQPWLLARTARQLPVTRHPQAPLPVSPRLMTALANVRVLPPPRLASSARGLRTQRGLPDPRAEALAAAQAQQQAAPATPETAKKMTPQELLEMYDAQGKKDERRGVLDQATMAMNSRFTNMRKAFHFVDVDNDGKVTGKEIQRALHMWGLDLEGEKLDMLVAQCDQDGDGLVSYNEFVDALARDTVAPAAMGKRDMQSLEAMGVDAQAHLSHEMGHVKHKNIKMPGYGDDEADVVLAPKGLSNEATLKWYDDHGMGSDRRKVKESAGALMNSRFKDMRKAFQYVDVNNDGRVAAKEIQRALHMWGLDLDAKQLDMLVRECDSDGDGMVSYNEFIDALARDTVAPVAMGKRDLQSKEAMGVDSQEYMAEQLGHKKITNFKMEF